MQDLIERLEAYDPKLSADNRADETDLHDSIVMATGIGSLTHAFEATFVRSIDAAMTLVPEGWRKDVMDADNGDCLCELWHEATDVEIALRAKTWPLALCIAALKAREQSK